MNFNEVLTSSLVKLIRERNLHHAVVRVKARTLTPEEAIGNPEHHDYPLIKGRERMMEAEFDGARGQAFTDRYGNFDGTLDEVADLPLRNSFQRAVLVATVNAVMRRFGLCEGTVHCRDDEPPKCAEQLVAYLQARYGNPRIAMVGLQPRMLERLSEHFAVRVTDLDEDNIGAEKFGVLVEGAVATNRNLEWCDLVFATGSTVCNDTMHEFCRNKPVVFFGVTVAGPAEILNLPRFCPLGH